MAALGTEHFEHVVDDDDNIFDTNSSRNERRVASRHFSSLKNSDSIPASEILADKKWA